MQVFHGSYTKIDEIDLSKGLLSRDFGQGFYVTKFYHHAETWAQKIGKRYQTEGFVTEFVFFDTPFTEQLCKVKHFPEYNEEWLDFVVMNRNPATLAFVHDYDIIEGPVADDKVQNRLDDYLKDKIAKADFLKELTYHEETHQICFRTIKSLLTLERIDTNMTSDVVHIGEPLVEALMLDHDIDEVFAADLFYNSDTFAKLSNASTGLHLKPWHEIYELLKKELGPNPSVKRQ
ncbi:MAG: DUF3990 domain-containing protein [Tannerellaceae bacterium]|jgi:hypothetical protein|nr:DUF3990 domain-containing protein [Tannerellaceae bacterium]